MHICSRRSRLCLVGCALVLLAAASVADAQTVTGTMQGIVTDSSGGVLPGVSITVKNEDTGAVRDLVTNGVGFYNAPFLAIGNYTVTAKLDGFQTMVQQTVSVSLNQTRVMDFELKPAGVAETVTVTGTAPVINRTNAEVKSILTAQEITDKPTLNPGSFLSLAEIFPGFQENPTSGQNNPTASSGSSINFNGTGSRGATFQINGVNNDDSSENQNRQGASLSTIKEFQVISNTFSAEFGRGYGAVVLVQTKSGTNQWHGEGFWYLQDSNDLTALRKFATVKPNNQRNQYGGTLGFPIAQNRLFAFVSLDRTKYEGTSNYARDFFLPSEVNSTWLTRGNDTAANRAWIQSILDRYPKDVTPNDPRSNRTYATTVGFNWPDQDYSGRLDWQLGQDSIVARYQYTAQVRQTNEVILGEQAKQDNSQQNLGITWTKVFRNNLVGEARYGLGYRWTRVDIAAGNDTPIVRFAGSPVSGTIIGNAGNFPIHRNQLDHQFVYNLSWVFARNHTFKAGTDIRRQQLDDLADNYSRGWWSFNRVCGGTTVRDRVCGDARRVRGELRAGVGALLPGEPDQRIELLRRGPVARVPQPHIEPRRPLRVRVGAEGERGPDHLRFQGRQEQHPAPRRRCVDPAEHDGLLQVADRHHTGCGVPQGRLRPDRRPHLPVGLLAGRRQHQDESARRDLHDVHHAAGHH